MKLQPVDIRYGGYSNGYLFESCFLIFSNDVTGSADSTQLLVVGSIDQSDSLINLINTKEV